MANVQNGNKRPNMNMPRPSWMWIYGIIAVMILGWYFLNGGSDAPLPSDWTAVEKMVEQGEV